MNPLLTQMRTYPFVALDEARRSALAAGRTLIDFMAFIAMDSRSDKHMVAPGSFFGECGEGYFRLALVPTVEDCQRAVAILEEVL